LIADMPRHSLPHLQRERTRHNRLVWYVRVGKGPRIRLRSEYGSQEFHAEYEAAVAGRPRGGKPSKTPGSLRWYWDAYRQSTSWTCLSLATRRQRENIFAHVLAKSGGTDVARIKRSDIVAGRERRAHTPAQARNFLDAMRGFFGWLVEAEHLKSDPTAGVKNPKRPKNQGFPVWTEDDVAKYEARWPIGTKERVWLDVLLYTGLRRGDAVTLGRQHVRDGIATLRTEKSQGTVTLTLPILDVLAATLAAGPCGDLAFICGVNGKPYTKESFGNLFREACDAAGVFGKSAHGLRKIGATRAADNGASESQLEAIFGWRGGAMASLYTRAANRKRLAIEAMSKLERTRSEQILPAPPPEGAGESAKKARKSNG
jgi:integrase